MILFGILAVSDPGLTELSKISGGLPFLIKDVLGENLGVLLLVEVIFAVFVCVLAVHAASIRLVFAMARDNNLPFARSLSHVSPRTRAPIVPALVVGILASAILVLNVNIPNVIEMLCSIAIIWANLAYLLVTFPLLLSRRRRLRRGRPVGPRDRHLYQTALRLASRSLVPISRWVAGACQSTWSRWFGGFSSSPTSAGRGPRFMGPTPGVRFAPRSATLALIAAGTVYYFLYQRSADWDSARARSRGRP